MGDLSRSFSSWEFRCKCGCGYEKVDPALVSLLQTIRDSLGESILVTSGVRCSSHNANVPGASKRSFHVPRDNGGMAADITFAGGSRPPSAITKLYILSDLHGAKGLGLYSNRVHVDCRPGAKKRWVHSSWSWIRV